MTTTTFEGPFPTDWAPPDDCDALTSNSIAGFDFDTTCLPRDFNPDPTAYYSPGFACPTGYTAQESCTRSSGATSTVTCCPVRNDITMWCVDDPGTLSDSWESMFCTWSAGDDETVLLVTTEETSTIAVTMSGAMGINAFGMKMVYESTDLETATSTETSASPPSSPATATPTSDGTSDEPQGATEDEGLSTGVKAAIGVIVPVVVIALAIGLFFLLRRRKQRPAGDEPKELPASSGGPPLSNYGNYNNGAYTGNAAYPNGDMYGAPGSAAAAASYKDGSVTSAHSMAHTLTPPPAVAVPPPQEMPAVSYVSELPADLQQSNSGSPGGYASPQSYNSPHGYGPSPNYNSPLS